MRFLGLFREDSRLSASLTYSHVHQCFYGTLCFVLKVQILNSLETIYTTVYPCFYFSYYDGSSAHHLHLTVPMPHLMPRIFDPSVHLYLNSENLTSLSYNFYSESANSVFGEVRLHLENSNNYYPLNAANLHHPRSFAIFVN